MSESFKSTIRCGNRAGEPITPLRQKQTLYGTLLGTVGGEEGVTRISERNTPDLSFQINEVSYQCLIGGSRVSAKGS